MYTAAKPKNYDVNNKVQYVMTTILTWRIQRLCQGSGVSDEGGRLEIVPEYRVTNLKASQSKCMVRTERQHVPFLIMRCVVCVSCNAMDMKICGEPIVLETYHDAGQVDV